jgi:hypothetical protein
VVQVRTASTALEDKSYKRKRYVTDAEHENKDTKSRIPKTNAD